MELVWLWIPIQLWEDILEISLKAKGLLFILVRGDNGIRLYNKMPGLFEDVYLSV